VEAIDRSEPEPKPALYPDGTVLTWLARHAIAIVSLLGICLLAWQWYDSHQEIGALRHELAQRLSAADAQNKESRALVDHVRDGVREIEVKLGMLDAKIHESQNQQLALEALYQELSRGRDESLLADVEQTLLVANQQLQVAGNVKSALIALQAADGRLARLDRPQLAGLRKVIAKDIERLRLAPHVDMIGISARLDNLIDGVDALPLVVDVGVIDTGAKKPRPPGDDNAWTRFTRELWQDLRGLVRIQNLSNPEMPILTPNQSYFLRENLKLRLLSARLSLLSRDERSFRGDLKASGDWIARYFDTRDKTVASALATIQQLNDSQINIELPSASASLDAVRNYRLSRERGR
jgi:uroporphyrin-3 C-methyltransferase